MLPVELIDHIFNFLRNDTSALQACSKAHPLYSRLAERHLYREFVIDPRAVSELYKHLSENPRFLDYPRTLHIRCGLHFHVNPSESVLLIMPMIPRMTNLISLTLHDLPCPFDLYDDFISTFRNCLPQLSIEQLCLISLYDFPLSVLDNCKTIKQLMLSDCTAEKQPVSSSPSSQQTLETLVLSNDHNPDLHVWATRRVTRLTSLGLCDFALDLEWTAFPGLLAACSNSLTSLHLDINCLWTSTYLYGANHHVGHWIDNLELPFTLSALMCLKKLSIFARMDSTATEVNCDLPAIVRLIKSAPALHDVFLSFHCRDSDSITSLGRLDWSLLDLLQSFAGTCPLINLCITGEGTVGSSPESILDALTRNDVLMDLVKRGLVILKSERTSVLEGWTESF